MTGIEQAGAEPRRGILVPLALTFLLGAVAGAFGGSVFSSRLPSSLLSASGSYQKGYDDARDALASSGLLPPAPQDIRELSGVVGEVGGSSFALTVRSPIFNPLDKDIPSVRTILIGGSTKIVAQIKSDGDEYQEALDAYQKSFANFVSSGAVGTPPAAPEPFAESDVALADLKSGDIVRVSAAEDVMKAGSFTAVKVVVESTMVGAAIIPSPVQPVETAPIPPKPDAPPPPADQIKK